MTGCLGVKSKFPHTKKVDNVKDAKIPYTGTTLNYQVHKQNLKLNNRSCIILPSVSD